MKNKIPWVFYLKVEIRKDWFAFYWTTRGANFRELQFWVFKISIGLPWLKIVIDSNIRDYGNLNCIISANKGNLKAKYTVKVDKNYK